MSHGVFRGAGIGMGGNTYRWLDDTRCKILRGLLFNTITFMTFYMNTIEFCLSAVARRPRREEVAFPSYP